MDECVYDNGGCQFGCQNEAGGYTCSCPDGYSLSPDMHTCTGKCTANVNILTSTPEVVKMKTSVETNDEIPENDISVSVYSGGLQ